MATGCRMCLIEVITDKDDCSKELLEVCVLHCCCCASQAVLLQACYERF